MADERESAPQPKPDTAKAGGLKRHPEPPEPRSFRPRAKPAPRQGAGDSSTPCGEGLLGPRGDPAEGKR